jgi:hypothetical protein
LERFGGAPGEGELVAADAEERGDSIADGGSCARRRSPIASAAVAKPADERKFLRLNGTRPPGGATLLQHLLE